MKLLRGKFRLGVRKKLLTEGVVRHWNRLPKKIVNAPSLDAFKANWMWQPGLVAGDPAHSRGVETQ